MADRSGYQCQTIGFSTAIRSCGAPSGEYTPVRPPTVLRESLAALDEGVQRLEVCPLVVAPPAGWAEDLGRH